MPLYGNKETLIRQLDTFDHAIGSIGGHDQAGSQIAQCLMMHTVDLHTGRAHNVGEVRPWLDRNRMGAIVTRELAPIVVADTNFMKVLRPNITIQRATAGDI